MSAANDEKLPELPATMRAAEVQTMADPRELFSDEARSYIRINDQRPLPQYGPNDVLVRNFASSINPLDWVAFTTQLAHLVVPKPYVPGADVGGVVVRVGSNVKDFKPGDAVLGLCNRRTFGAFAEYAVVSQQSLVKKPPSLTFAEAGVLPLVGLTALQSLISYGKLQRGEKVLILNGSGGVGLCAIQLARHYGASVIACTTSAKNFDLVKEAGATMAIDYKTQAWWNELRGQGFDVVIDAIGGPNNWYHAESKVLKPSGRFVALVGDEKLQVANILELPMYYARVIARKIKSFWNSPEYHGVLMMPQVDHLKELCSLAEAGKLKLPIEQEFHLEQVPEMYIRSFEGHVNGKLALILHEHAHSK